MQSDWIKTRCRLCGSRTVIHKDWKSPDPDCGVCKLISGKVVDAIEMLLINKYVGTPEDAKNKLRDLIKLSNGTYNENLRNGIEKSIAWRIAERQLADRVWNDKELRKATLFAIKELRRYEKEDARAELRNELRAARISNGTRRWTG